MRAIEQSETESDKPLVDWTIADSGLWTEPDAAEAAAVPPAGEVAASEEATAPAASAEEEDPLAEGYVAPSAGEVVEGSA